jgi:hypothetical protein
MIRIIVGVNLGLTGLLFYLLFELHKVVEQLGVSLDGADLGFCLRNGR